MEAADVLDLLQALDELQIACWVDGGWGVDCLVGRQTRPHGDLDLVLARTDVEQVRALLAARGYAVIRDWLPTSLALRDADGREVDLHPVDPTDDGGGVQVLPDGGTWRYAAPVPGAIAGVVVPCAPATDQLLMHQGYRPRDVDHADVRLLAETFGLEPPAPFA